MPRKGGGPKTRERRPGQEAAHLENKDNSNTQKNIGTPDFSQAAENWRARILARKYSLSWPVARFYAAEITLAGAGR